MKALFSWTLLASWVTVMNSARFFRTDVQLVRGHFHRDPYAPDPRAPPMYEFKMGESGLMRPKWWIVDREITTDKGKVVRDRLFVKFDRMEASTKKPPNPFKLLMNKGRNEADKPRIIFLEKSRAARPLVDFGFGRIWLKDLKNLFRPRKTVQQLLQEEEGDFMEAKTDLPKSKIEYEMLQDERNMRGGWSLPFVDRYTLPRLSFHTYEGEDRYVHDVTYTVGGVVDPYAVAPDLGVVYKSVVPKAGWKLWQRLSSPTDTSLLSVPVGKFRMAANVNRPLAGTFQAFQ